jgi:hypothetical protein
MKVLPAAALADASLARACKHFVATAAAAAAAETCAAFDVHYGPCSGLA